MSRQASPRKLSYDDYVGFPDDGLRHEIIDGEHHVCPAPALRHQRVAQRLNLSLAAYVLRVGLGEVLMAPLDVVLSPHDVVQPDLIFLTAMTLRAALAEEERYIGRPPTLAIEILSPTTRHKDLELKRRLYEQAGVPEYWIVDPDRTAVTIFRRTAPSNTEYTVTIELSADRNDVLSTPLIPGWEMPLASLRL